MYIGSCGVWSPTPAHSTITYSDTTNTLVGSTANATCNTYYVQTGAGPTYATCNSPHSWSSATSLVTCSCINQAYSDHATIDKINCSSSYSTMFRFGCNKL